MYLDQKVNFYPSNKYQFQFQDNSAEAIVPLSIPFLFSIPLLIFAIGLPESKFSTLYSYCINRKHCTQRTIKWIKSKNSTAHTKKKTFSKLDAIYTYMSFKSENERVNREPKNKSSIL